MAVEAREWFPFYPADWLADDRVSLLSLAQQGIYLRLLCHCWRDGSVSADVGVLSKLVGGVNTKTLLPVIVCFEERVGRLYQKRLEAERAKQQKDSELQSQRGKAGAKSRWRKHAPSIAAQMAQAKPDDGPCARADYDEVIVRTESIRAAPNASAMPPPSTRARPEPVADARSKRPIFMGQRVKIFEWMLTELCALLGSQADEFTWDEWFYELDTRAQAEKGIIRDRWKWIREQTLGEAKLRGLLMAGESSDPYAGWPCIWDCRKCGEMHEGTREQGDARVCLADEHAVRRG